MSDSPQPEISTFRVGSEDFINHTEEEAPRVYWWGISRGRLVFVAIGHSSMEAHSRVAERLGISLEEYFFVIPSAELYSDEIQQQLAAKFGENVCVRLLARSFVEWPEDLDQLTDEQKAHGIEHGWLNPDGTWPENS